MYPIKKLRHLVPKTRPRLGLVFLFLLVFASPLWGGERQSLHAPARVVSLSPLLTENIFLLGAGERLVGDTVYCQRPEAARFLEKIGSVQELSIEKIVSLRPELVLSINLNPRQQIQKLRELGLRVEVFGQPASFTDICAQFHRLGELLGLQPQAEAIIAQAQAQVETIRLAVNDLPKIRVFLQVGASPLFSSVKNSFTHDFIELAGGINIAGDQRMGTMKTEQVIALNPQVIIIAVMGSENGIGAQEKERWLQFATIDAVRDQRVYPLNPDLVCSPSPLTFADTLLTFARLIHPEAIINLPPAKN
ncbi:ABC transporter substrate-binding protein [Desulfobulbus rhabdoformis]|uniref:ABC transporter substrate-binding protein n=1 Tax=Desulfobulbus rhabdoformis TaxID=34032 RepID=UPI0019654F5C|nr:helical backbone metal receptor [Desulfobulbus rhabdoformis]MBM9613721.1 ABC transporter substrate-binding protein [Desulfobulbus rhabdoformis]